MSTGREPSSEGNTTEPLTPGRRSASSIAEGSTTASRPRSRITNTPASSHDPNLFFDPVTGYNRHPSTAGRPDPKFTSIQWLESKGRADYAALATGFTRRYRNNFQANIAYTLMFFMHDSTTGFQYQGNNPFDPEAEWARSTDFQRHTVRFNGIWRLPYDISLSGAYLFGSGNYFGTTVALNPYGHTGTTRLNSGTTTFVIPESIRISGSNSRSEFSRTKSPLIHSRASHRE